MIPLPSVLKSAIISSMHKRLFIGAYGFEERSLGWVKSQGSQKSIIDSALVFRYVKPKGPNLIEPLRLNLGQLGCKKIESIPHNVLSTHNTERVIEEILKESLVNIEEVVIDISAMTKLLILITLYKLKEYQGKVRIVYSEASDYAPGESDYELSKSEMELMAKYPSTGFETIIRTKCLSSIRMQGQPLTMIAFTSFNEQLVRHMRGSMTPHRLILINGRPSRRDLSWREMATQEIHKKIIEEYLPDNPVDQNGRLVRVASTLDYRETIDNIQRIYEDFGSHERIICAATGSKMQTVGLFMCKVIHPDIHIEYPTPDSYFVKGFSKGIKNVYEVFIPKFAELSKSLYAYTTSA